MSDEEKDVVETVNDEAEVEVKAEAEVEDEVGVEADVEAEVGVETEAEVETEVEGEIPEPAEVSPRQRGTSMVRASDSTGAGPTANERTWAALAHASVLLTFALGVSTGGIATVVAALVPLFIWLAFRDRSRFVAFHAMQATVFQLGSLVAWIGILVVGLVILIPTWIVTVLLSLILVGLLLLPLALVLTVVLPGILIALPFASLVYGLYGAYEVYVGRPFRYWRVADWIESRGVKMT